MNGIGRAEIVGIRMTEKHLTWRRGGTSSDRTYTSMDGAFLINRNAQTDHRWCLWIGDPKNILVSSFDRLAEAQSHAQSMRDAGNA